MNNISIVFSLVIFINFCVGWCSPLTLLELKILRYAHINKHHGLLENNYNHALQRLFLTVILGIYFTALQAYEYLEASFTIADFTLTFLPRDLS